MNYKLIKVGSGKDNDVVLNQSEISNYHAEFFKNEDGLIFLTDLNSQHGTFVNNIRLTSPVQLQPNDKVKFGNIDIDWMNFFRVNPELIIENDPKVELSNKPASGIPTYAYILLILLFSCGGIYALNEFLLTNSDENSSSSSSLISNENSSNENHSDSQLNNSKEVEYNYDCLGTDLLNEASALEADLIDMTGVTVTVSEEEEVGEEVYKSMKDEYSLVQGSKLSKCTSIMNKLIPHIKNPKGFNYKIYVLDTDMINAFTAGGYIFVTTGIIDFCKNDSELACIIGHEIAHNERGHIQRNIKKHKFNQGLFGDFFGGLADDLSSVFTAPFNQKNETESDYYGIGYAHNAGYDVCVSVDLWQRMAKDESEFNHLDNMMRTHPYSKKRSDCCKNHIESNYNKTCP